MDKLAEKEEALQKAIQRESILLKTISDLEFKIKLLDQGRTDLIQTIERQPDPVNHPAHYTAGKVECIDAIEAATIGLNGGVAYCTGAAIKYLWRWSRKGGVEDLRKAQWYVDRLIKQTD